MNKPRKKFQISNLQLIQDKALQLYQSVSLNLMGHFDTVNQDLIKPM